ncbi:MAG: pyridoxamine 5'-phosphate oxidase [Bacteroidetes bacterium QH_10_64_37]|jgi:pyridoxine/pyridoxamine 5'-phosphate oxidase|nr:MAG: pyridoxamine 5'-phosphate oxidase [Bacteroidetes bacterium QH_10_64_37]
MSLPRYTNLDAVLNHVWDEIEAAAEAPDHAYRQLTFGTVHDRAPDLRTVVLRRADEDDRRLQFHTDRRARKVEALRKNDRIAWHGWDADAHEQIRLYGTASVHFDDDVAMDLWETQSPDTLAVYARPSAPGTPLDEPDDGLRQAVKSEPITDDDVAEGRQYFAAIRTVIDRIEWLHLHPDGHYRARFEYQSDREAFESGWVVP